MEFNGIQTMSSMDSMQNKDHHSPLYKWHKWSVMERPRRLDPVDPSNLSPMNLTVSDGTLQSGPHEGHASPMMAHLSRTANLGLRPIEAAARCQDPPGAPYRGNNGTLYTGQLHQRPATIRGPLQDTGSRLEKEALFHTVGNRVPWGQQTNI